MVFILFVNGTNAEKETKWVSIQMKTQGKRRFDIGIRLLHKQKGKLTKRPL